MHRVNSCGERNGRCFEDKSNSFQKIKENCIVSSYFWNKEVGLEDSDHFADSFKSHGSWKYFLLSFMYLTLFDDVQHVLNALC